MRKSGSKRLLEAVEELLGEISVLPFDVPADAEYGESARSWRQAERRSAATTC